LAADIDWNFMRLLRWTARTAGAALVGFHVWLLATQWAAGRLVNDPALLFRWAAALVLAAALIWLGREGNSLFNRRTVVIWLLAALLHAPAVASQTGDLQTLPETAATLVLQAAITAGLLGVSIAALWILAGLFRRRDLANRAWSLFQVPPAWQFPDDGFALVVAARPPPAVR
jgi:hypothetical protein